MLYHNLQEYAQEALNAIHGEPEAAAPSSSGLRVGRGVAQAIQHLPCRSELLSCTPAVHGLP